MDGLKVAINTTCAVAGGAVTHLRNLLPPLVERAGDHRLILLGEPSTREKLNSPEGVEWVDLPPATGGLVGRVWRENTLIPRMLRDLEADVVFHPGNFGIFRTETPQVILIHNLAPFLTEVIDGESAAQKVRLALLRRLTHASIARVDRVVFISKWGRELVLGSASADESRLPVIPFGSEHGARGTSDEPLDRFGLEHDGFVLSVSHIYRYKKIEKLIDAWNALGDRVADMPLLIVGEPFDQGYTARLEELAKSAKGRIVFTGSLDASSLATLMEATRCFVFTSEAENLPITLLEAMAARCPIITNRFCSMPETCEEAALYAEPATAENYRTHLESILFDDVLREDMRVRAERRAGDFRWGRVAEETLALLVEAARGKRGR